MLPVGYVIDWPRGVHIWKSQIEQLDNSQCPCAKGDFAVTHDEARLESKDGRLGMQLTIIETAICKGIAVEINNLIFVISITRIFRNRLDNR